MANPADGFRAAVNDHDDDAGMSDGDFNEAEALRNTIHNAGMQSSLHSAAPSEARRRPGLVSRRSSHIDQADGRSVSETSHLLSAKPSYTSIPPTPSGFGRGVSTPRTLRNARTNASRRSSFARSSSVRLLGAEALDGSAQDTAGSKPSLYVDDRAWYDQFTSTDWVHDSVADANRKRELRSRKDFAGRLQAIFDGAHGWILVAVIGCLTAGVSYLIDITEALVFDFKTGHCRSNWLWNRRRCCDGAETCDDWHRWSGMLSSVEGLQSGWLADYAVFILWVLGLSLLACLVTLQTKTTITSPMALSTLDENLGATHAGGRKPGKGDAAAQSHEVTGHPPMTYYPAAGSGVAEVRVILSGFVMHGYLGMRTLICKSVGIVLSVASGLSIGKEGPYVHIATCIGNIASRFSYKYRINDAKRREVLSASAAAGVAVAFGSPLGGVLFSLEEVSYFFPPKTLFRTFFCCIAAALSLKFLNPYGTNKIVLFQVRYTTDWKFFEILLFALLGVLGGLTGALFIKASRFWASTFRRIPLLRTYPVIEVLLVALLTGLVSYWHRFTRLPVAELLYELAAPCNAFSPTPTNLCPTEDNIPAVITYLFIAFLIKAALTTVSFGIKLPAGIYVPSMVVGGLLGRIIGHIMQLLILRSPSLASLLHCPADGNPESCVVPGVYALVAAGATMCGVTRLSVTLAVILFELTGSLDHVLPFSIAVLIAKWTADAVEPLSIYDLLSDMNSYPYLDHKARPVFPDVDLADLLSLPIDPARVIDISFSPAVPASVLRAKLEFMHLAGELDGGLPIVRHGVLVGLLPAPDLEFALDRLESDPATHLSRSSSAASSSSAHILCHMDPHALPSSSSWSRAARTPRAAFAHDDDENASLVSSSSSSSSSHPDPTNFIPFIDTAPVCLHISSPIDLVYECFSKLGLRYLCVLEREGRFAGLLHKKTFVRYVKDLERRKEG